MITISFEKRGNLGLCDYLYGQLKNQILTGALSADEKLPSKRTLAQNLGISVITVQNAYARLISEGYIYSVEKKGFFVTDLLPVKNFSPSKKTEALVSEEAKHEFYADFSSSAVAFRKFPFSQWSRIMRSVLNSGEQKLLERSDAHGTLELRLAIAKYLKEFRGMDVQCQQIVVGSGTENIFSMLVSLLGNNRIYAVENPGYKKISSVIKMNGAKCLPVSLDSSGMSLTSLLKSNADVVHLSPSHHFPTGIVMPVRRRQEILEWAKKGRRKKRFIIEDDYDCEFRFYGKPLPTLQSQDTENSVIYVNTFSKTLSPSFRIGYMVLPENLVPVFDKCFSSYSCPVSAFEQYTLSRFITGGFYGSHIIRMKNYYRSLRNELIQSIEKSSLAEYFSIHEEEAGLHFLLTLKDSFSEQIKVEKLAEALRKNKDVNIPLIKDFFYGRIPEKEKKTFVVNYSGIKKECIKETVSRIEGELPFSSATDRLNNKSRKQGK